MSFEAIDEHERSQQLKEWLRKNVGTLFISISAALALIAGYHYWQSLKVTNALKAAESFEQLAKTLEDKDKAKTEAMIKSFKASGEKGGFAVMTALSQAQTASAEKNDKAADEAFAWAQSAANTVELKALVDLRVARVKLARGESEAALKIAQAITAKGFNALAGELRGDALLALKRPAEAFKEYDAALTEMDTAAAGRATLEMKRDDLIAYAKTSDAVTTGSKS